jgi:hypothetical protein
MGARVNGTAEPPLIGGPGLAVAIAVAVGDLADARALTFLPTVAAFSPIGREVAI